MKRYKGISIVQRLYFTVGLMAIFITLLLFIHTWGANSRDLEKLLFVIALIVGIVALLLLFSVSTRIKKGLKAISHSLKKIKQGDLTERVPIVFHDEIGATSVAINTMADKLIRSNEELSQFAYITSHDLQDPLRSILNFTDMLVANSKNKLDGDSEKYLGYIQSSAYRMQAQISDLLEYARMGADDKKEDVDCMALMKEAMEDLRTSIEGSNAEIELSTLPEIFATKHIKLLMQNLLNNAIKYRKPQERPKINIQVREDKDVWLFSVSDNGIGIAKEHQERIFVIFQKLHSRKEYEGTGIGLAQCKRIVEMNRGQIWVESEIGRGSTFYFTIPKQQASNE